MRLDFTDCFAVPGEDSIIDGVNPDTGRSLILGQTLEQVQSRYPAAVIVSWEAWRAEQAAKQDTPISWCPSTEKQYHEMLNVLPPAAWVGGLFLVGEPTDHSFSTGQPRYEAYWQRGSSEYFVSSRPITVAEFRTALRGGVPCY